MKEGDIVRYSSDRRDVIFEVLKEASAIVFAVNGSVMDFTSLELSDINKNHSCIFHKLYCRDATKNEIALYDYAIGI